MLQLGLTYLPMSAFSLSTKLLTRSLFWPAAVVYSRLFCSTMYYRSRFFFSSISTPSYMSWCTLQKLVSPAAWLWTYQNRNKGTGSGRPSTVVMMQLILSRLVQLYTMVWLSSWIMS